MLNGMKRFALRLRKDESGAAMVEYSVLIGLITAATIAMVVAVGLWANTQWTTLNTALQGGGA